jgi:magnesium-transporting ATPase (P-type)
VPVSSPAEQLQSFEEFSSQEDGTIQESAALHSSYAEGRGRKPEAKYELAIVKRFDFESKLQRMSVIVKNMKDGSFRAYVKGSPEKVAELCREESLPADYAKQLEVYTLKGYRVIALAVRFLENINFM